MKPKSTPITFPDAMVNAILSGKKTQARFVWEMPSWAEWDTTDNGESRGQIIPKNPKLKGWYSLDEVKSPYGREGDTLWVKETLDMPKLASRITLKITSVRVERLHDISKDDVIAEGCYLGSEQPANTNSARNTYREQWEAINGDHSWETNPWVWVIEFNHEVK